MIKEKIITDKIYYLGDTVDDMSCAITANVAGIGVLPPQDKSEELKQLLKSKDAMVVLEQATDLEEFLEILMRGKEMRTSLKERKTLETEVKIELNIDGTGKREITTPIKFFSHLLEQFAAHGGFDLKIDVKSHDKDNHHVVEDVALTLGEAF